jgi:beta-adrenergic-receptor kinase
LTFLLVLVKACKKGTSGKLFAMKIMNKKRMKRKKSEQLALNELNALKAVDSPFVVKLFYAFQSNENLFLILDLMMGGNLAYHLQLKGQFSKLECIYFSGRILLGLQALHDCNYVYRDLKPDNVLVAYDGRVKLSDLGLATPLTPTLHGPAGTRGYWAPEMLQKDASGHRQTYDQTVDWFSFGCCVYEFISGYNPFRSQDALQFGLKAGMVTKENALDYATLKMQPPYDSSLFDKSAEDLCRRLLDKDNRKRLGRNGCQEIKDHPYYWRLNWESIVSDRMSPPFIPEKDVNALPQSDIGTFSPEDGDNEISLEPSDDAIYKEWNWTNQNAFDGEVIEFLIHERRIGKPLLPDEPSNCSSCCTCL